MIEIKPEAKKTDGITNDFVEIVRPSIEKVNSKFNFRFAKVTSV